MDPISQTSVSEPVAAPMPAAVSASKKDFLCAAFIGICFGLFSIPILSNIKLPFLTLGIGTYAALVVFFFVLAIVAIWIASLLGKVMPVIFQFAKFAATGAFNSFLDWGVLNVLISLTGLAAGGAYVGFKAGSFIIANISSYFWNKHWTFENTEKSNTKEIGSFAAVSIIGLLINIGVAYLIVTILSNPAAGEVAAKRLANIGALCATVVSLIWNFVGYKFFVFKK